MNLRLVAAAGPAVAECSSPELWEERGFDSKEGCYRTHGYDGGSISTSDFRRYEYWCGPGD